MTTHFCYCCCSFRTPSAGNIAAIFHNLGNISEISVDQQEDETDTVYQPNNNDQHLQNNAYSKWIVSSHKGQQTASAPAGNYGKWTAELPPKSSNNYGQWTPEKADANNNNNYTNTNSSTNQ